MTFEAVWVVIWDLVIFHFHKNVPLCYVYFYVLNDINTHYDSIILGFPIEY